MQKYPWLWVAPKLKPIHQGWKIDYRNVKERLTMAFRMVYGQFWTDPKVMEEMTPEDKFFYVYILTNPSTTSCGIYIITKKQMAFEMGYSIETINNLMDRLQNHHKLIRYNAETRELAIKNWGKHNLNKGGKPFLDCLKSELSKVKDKNLIKYVYDNIRNQNIKELFSTYFDTPTTGEPIVPPLGDNKEREKDIKKDKNINIEIEREVDKDDIEETNIHESRATVTDEEKVQQQSLSLIEKYEKLTGKAGILNLAAIRIAVLQHGKNNVEKAMDKALEKGKFSMSYINGILRTWAKEGYPKEGDNIGIRNPCKDNGASTNEFSGFKPREPRGLTDEQRKAIEEELI
jgi:DnaD/phage-associated family protein